MSMKKLVLLLAVVMVLSACGSIKRTLGLEKGPASGKEELVIPPNFDSRPVVPTKKAENEK